MSAHISTRALSDKLPRGNCKACPKGALFCRHDAPLNGREAAAEFTRHLLPHVRAALIERVKDAA